MSDTAVPGWATKTVDKYRDEVAAALGVEPMDVRIVMEDLGPDGMLAETRGDTIVLNTSLVGEKDEGAIVHEMAHAYMGASYYVTEGNEWLMEGIADYVKDSLGFGESDPNQSATEGYQGTAAFLEWIEAERPGSVQAMAKSLSDGTWGKGSFEEIVGINKKTAVSLFTSGQPAPGAVVTDPTQPEGGRGSMQQRDEMGKPIYSSGNPPPTGSVVAGGGGTPTTTTTTTTTSLTGDTDGDGVISQEEIAQLIGASTAEADPVVTAYSNAYFELWGQAPPNPNYIQKRIDEGMNYYEFLDAERAKPAFAKTETYRNETAQAAQDVAQLLGMR